MRNRKPGLLLALVFSVSGFLVTPALAAPTLELGFSNEPTTLPRTDEGMYYTATVKNTAGANPEVGDQVSCEHDPVAPGLGKDWFGRPEPALTYQWLRNGEAIAGATANTYAVTEADKGKSLQCVITGTNQSTPSGTATIEEGSDVITDVITATGSGILKAGSTEITGLMTTAGRFATGQTISGPGIPPGATVTVAEALPDPHTELFLSAPATASGPQAFSAGPGGFGVNAAISGPGIPPGTTVTAVNGRSLTLSANASATATGVEISGSYAPVAYSTASLPPVVVAPAPTPAAPSGTTIPVTSSTSNAKGGVLTCIAPSGLGAWTGNGIEWSFQWLRNGVPAPHAALETTPTTSKYELQSADVEPPSRFACEAIAKDAEGNEAVAIGLLGDTKPSAPSPYDPPFGRIPTVAVPNSTSAPVTLEVELPSGSETFLTEAKGAGWKCEPIPASPSVPAKAICTREDSLAPGDSYPPLSVAAHLGVDAPDLGVAKARLSGGGAAPASGEATYTFTPGIPFGAMADSFEARVLNVDGASYNTAGGHPYMGYSTFGFNVHRQVSKTFVPTERIKDVVVDVPRGFVGNALATPELCDSVEAVNLALCPPGSIVGGIDIYLDLSEEAKEESPYPDHPLELTRNVPIYSLEPEFGQPAQFAFSARSTPYTFVPELRADEGYAISFRTAPIITNPALYGTNINLCDFGAKINGTGQDAKFAGCRKPTEAGANPVPLITNPTRCSGPPPTTKLRIDSWEHPQDVKTYDFSAPAIEECEAVDFEPEAQLIPTNRQADSPTGLGVEITMPTEGLLSPTGISQANLDTATVTFPKGMTINPATADGLSSCSLAQIKLHSNAPDECPESSRVGTVEIDTPLIRKTLTGSVYVAKQNENPFNAPLGLYMSFSSARDGVRVKVAGKLTPDPVTGQLVSTFTESPEAPFSRLALNFTSGPRAPLINPPKCGSYVIHSEFSPWSAVNPANPTADEIVSQDSRYKVTQGPNGSPCPTGALDPKLKAGITDPTAGAKSPFVLSLSREDGTQRFTGLSVTNPKGLTAYLKGVASCPESSLANISGAEEAGAGEIANPSCPANSLVGIAEAGSGAGPLPFYVKTGKVYLAGPYKAAPVSLAIVTPAVAGPYDFGNVLVRTPLYIDPETAQVRAVSDPIPTALHGIALDVREIRVALDRPSFTAAPTNCEPSSVDATVQGADGASATVSNRFQVGGCEKLAFKPKLAFRLFGGTHRGSHPRLRATVNYPPGPGYANIAKASVALPHSEFLDQAHINTVCTRVQFAAKACPAGSIYGEAEATSPLVDYTLRGPVYLRSSSHQLPDMVVALRGPESQPIEIDLVGRIDSVNGGIRSTFESVPDQPVSSFTLNMKGGKKGLLVNSRNICSSTQKATAVFNAQNGRALTLRPKMQNACAKQRKGKKHKKNSGKGAKRHNGR